jgi:hypothetical protein
MYKEQTFAIPELKGLSKKSIEEHLKLYAGYVKNSNTIIDKIKEYSGDPEKNAFTNTISNLLKAEQKTFLMIQN